MTKLLFIAIGGAVGSVLRYLLGTWVQRSAGAGFPWGTLVVNVSGCLLIGLLSAAMAGRFAVHRDVQLGLIVGVLGGFTTFSAFGLETVHLLSAGQGVRAGAYVLASVALGLAAVWAGLRIGAAIAA